MQTTFKLNFSETTSHKQTNQPTKQKAASEHALFANILIYIPVFPNIFFNI